VQEAAKKPVQIAEAAVPSAPAPVPTPAPAPPAKTPARKKLPKTASDYPLLGMLGLLSLAGAGTLRMFARLRG
jgi:LPXTG-motif cell wall-anchored protein